MELLEQLPRWLYISVTYLGLMFGLCQVVDFVFDQDDVLKPPMKQKLGNWLRNVTYADRVVSWPATFVALFDRWYGKKHWTWNCFLRSCVTSTCLLTLLYFVHKAHSGEMQTMEAMEIYAVLILAAWLNFMPDYTSLLESRILLNKALHSSGRILFIILIVDFLITSLIFYLYFFLISFLFDDKFHSPLEFWHILSTEHLVFLAFTTTYFTSVWLWLYAAAAFLVKLIGKSEIGVRFLQHRLDLENKPYKSLGKFVQIIIVILFIIGAPFVLL